MTHVPRIKYAPPKHWCQLPRPAIAIQSVLWLVQPMTHDDDAQELEARIAALERNIAIQRKLIERLLANTQSVAVAERMLRRLEARLARLTVERSLRKSK